MITDRVFSRISWALGLTIAISEVLVLYRMGPGIFYVGDDTLIQQILSGSATGGDPSAYTVFVGFGLSWILTLLFRILPQIPWWSFFSFAAISFALGVINRCIFGFFKLMKTGDKDLSKSKVISVVILSAIACMAVGVGICSIVILQIQFSYTAMICGSGTIVSMGYYLERYFLFETDEDKIQRIGSIVLIFVLTVLSISIRQDVGLITLAFCFALWVVLCVCSSGLKSRDNKTIKRFAWKGIKAPLMGIAPCIAVTLVLIISALAYSAPGWQEFAKVNNARSDFVDYQRGSYEENRAVYEEVGWDKDLYTLVRRLYFIDPDVNGDTLSYVNEQTLSSVRHQNAITAFLSRTGPFADKNVNSLTILTSATLVGYLIIAKQRRFRIAGVLLFVLSGALLCYLGLIGRLIVRAVIPVIILALFCLWTGLFCSCIEESRANAKAISNKQVIVSKAVLVVYLFACLIPFHYALAAVTSSQDAINRAQGNQTVRLVDDYIQEHSTDIFIFGGSKYQDSDVSNSYDPANKLYWGGWRYFAPWYQDALAAAGFPKSFSESDFLLENVYFVSLDDSSADLLSRHLSTALGYSVIATPVHEIETATIYSFRPA